MVLGGVGCKSIGFSSDKGVFLNSYIIESWM